MRRWSSRGRVRRGGGGVGEAGLGWWVLGMGGF